MFMMHFKSKLIINLQITYNLKNVYNLVHYLQPFWCGKVAFFLLKIDRIIQIGHDQKVYKWVSFATGSF